MKKRIIALLLCLAALVAVLASCAGSIDADSEYKGQQITMYLSENIYDLDPVNAYKNESMRAIVSLLFDSGHLAYCGEDYMRVLRKYIGRIKHVHLKDVRPDVVAEVKRNHLSFLQGVRKGTFTVPGDGSIDFAPIFEVIAKSGYEGWLLVEAEQDPQIANPLEYAIKARKYIKAVGKI